jgi:LemA protein
MNPLYIILIIVAIILLILVISYISISNGLTKAQIKIDEALSGIDVALTKRYDVLTKMIDVVKGYTKHEKETLFEVINLRKDMTLNERSKASAVMDNNIKKINALAESYPDLKANENFKTLQLTIADVEEHLQAARRLYNSNVSIYNQKVEMFPSSIIAKNRNLVKKDFFEAEEAQKEDVKINF